MDIGTSFRVDFAQDGLIPQHGDKDQAMVT